MIEFNFPDKQMDHNLRKKSHIFRHVLFLTFDLKMYTVIIIINISLSTHISLVFLWDLCKQCRPISDPAESQTPRRAAFDQPLRCLLSGCSIEI